MRAPFPAKPSKIPSLGELVVVAHSFNPSIQEAERQADVCEFEASLVYLIPGQPGIHRETLFHKTNKTKNQSLTGRAIHKVFLSF